MDVIDYFRLNKDQAKSSKAWLGYVRPDPVYVLKVLRYFSIRI